MTKMFSTMILSGLAMISAAYAQSGQPIQAKIPFAFTVQNTTLAAGNYRMSYSHTARMLFIYGVEDTAGGAFAPVLVESAPGAWKQSAKLVFRCHDKACYLAQVWQGNIGGDRRLEVRQTARERKLTFETRVVTIANAAK